MIRAKVLLRMVRQKQQDVNEVKFSDYDVLAALNECLRYVNQSFARKNSDFLERVKSYRQDEINAEIVADNVGLSSDDLPQESISFAATGVVLPDDFVALVSVARASDGYLLSPVAAVDRVGSGQYKIFGGRIYAAEDFDIMYRAQVPVVRDMEQDVIELPVSFLDLLVKVTGLVLNNAETDVLAHEVSSNVDGLVPKRRYSNVKSRMPFVV